MVSPNVARALEDKASLYHKFFVCTAYSLFEFVIPAIFTLREELNSILFKQLGDISAPGFSIRFVPELHVPFHKLINLAHHILSFSGRYSRNRHPELVVAAHRFFNGQLPATQ